MTAWRLCTLLVPWLLMACLSGCDLGSEHARGTAPAGTAEHRAAAGVDDADELGFRLTVFNVRDCEPPLGVSLEPGERFVGIEVELEALSTRRVPANFFYATLLDDREREVRAEPGGCQPELEGKPLDAGERRRGFVSFHLPKDAQGLKLRYTPRLEGASSAPRTLEIDVRP